MNIINFILNFICCAANTTVKVASVTTTAATAANNSICCLPVKCAIEIKNCYDHCTAEVGIENDVEMTGSAPAEIIMS